MFHDRIKNFDQSISNEGPVTRTVRALDAKQCNHFCINGQPIQHRLPVKSAKHGGEVRLDERLAELSALSLANP
jgi:hypothetical protein